MDKVKVETRRLFMREINGADFEALCKILQDDDAMFAYEGGFSDEEVQSWINRQVARYEKYGFGLWAAVEKASGEVIGQCGLSMQEFNGSDVLEVGYLFQRAYWHKGYATEAARACIEYAFDVLNEDKISCIIRDINLPSVRVAERLGMNKRGISVRHFRGIDMPHFLFELCREKTNTE